MIKKALTKFARFYLPALVYLLLAFFLFRYAAAAKAENTQLSLRYTDYPLTGAQVAYARGYLQDEETESDYTLTFWFQRLDVTFSNDFGTSSGNAVVYADGAFDNVYPAEFIAGGYPTQIDKNGIAVSEMTAWKLFGGGETLGQMLEIDGVEYYVRGVFKGLDPVVLMQVDGEALPEDAVFTGVDFYGRQDFGDPRENAVAFARTLGLGDPVAVVDGEAMATLMQLLALLPAILLLGWFLIKGLRELHRAPFWPRQLVWLAVLLGLAYLIPWALGQLPGWMIPNKWSDLDAWSDFATSMRGYINEWLALQPSLRDVSLKMALLGQAAMSFAALTAVGITIRVWNARINAALQAHGAVLVQVEEMAQIEQESADGETETLLLEAGAELFIDDLAPGFETEVPEYDPRMR